MSKINVFDNDKIIAIVEYNDILDYWDGCNMTNGGVGKHKGITKLKNGPYVIIYGSQWAGSKDYAVVMNNEDALQQILRAGRADLLEKKKFAELKVLYENMTKENDSE